jgi:hypothetical protein
VRPPGGGAVRALYGSSLEPIKSAHQLLLQAPEGRMGGSRSALPGARRREGRRGEEAPRRYVRSWRGPRSDGLTSLARSDRSHIARVVPAQSFVFSTIPALSAPPPRAARRHGPADDRERPGAREGAADRARRRPPRPCRPALFRAMTTGEEATRRLQAGGCARRVVRAGLTVRGLPGSPTKRRRLVSA